MALLISNDVVRESVTVAECVTAIEAAYRAAGRNEAVAEPRSVFWSPLGPGRRHGFATLQGVGLNERIAAIRVRSDVYSTVESGGASRDEKSAGGPGFYCGLVFLFSVDSGELVAIANDGILQQIRVASTAALAARSLARSDSRTVGIIGAGNQAHWHARAFAHEFELTQIRIFSPDAVRRAKAAHDLEHELGVEVTAVATPSDAVGAADIVATCTNARTPVIDALDVREGAFVTSVRHRAEMDPRILDLADVIVVNEQDEHDDWVMGTPEQQAESKVPPRSAADTSAYPSLVDLVTDESLARRSDRERTYFMNNQGSGLQFVAVGALALRAARERGLGQQLPSEWFLQNTSS